MKPQACPATQRVAPARPVTRHPRFQHRAKHAQELLVAQFGGEVGEALGDSRQRPLARDEHAVGPFVGCRTHTPLPRAAPRVPRCGCDPNHLAANHVRTCRRAPFASDRSRFAGNSEPPGPTCGTSAPGSSQARRTHRRDLLTATAASPRRAFGLTMRSSPVHAVSPDAFARHRARGYALT